MMGSEPDSEGDAAPAEVVEEEKENVSAATEVPEAAPGAPTQQIVIENAVLIAVMREHPTRHTKYVPIKVDGQRVEVPVSDLLYQSFDDHFRRGLPSALQKKRYFALLDIAAAAFEFGYHAGLEAERDG